MPSISATMQPALGRVLIQISWVDVPTVLFARVIRVESDGTETVVRPHTSVDSTGDYIELSGGEAILYDTEAPMDVPLYYRTEGLGVSVSSGTMLTTQVLDTFTRTIANSWGVADTGQTYLTVGPNADYSVNGAQGIQSISAVNSYRLTNPQPVRTANASFSIDVTVPVVALTSPIVTEVWLRAISSSTRVLFRLSWAPSTAVTISASVTIANVTQGASGSVVSDWPHVAGQQWRVAGQIVGSDVKMRAWPLATPDPGWQIQFSNSFLPNAGDVDIANFLSGGNTNALPVAISYDNFVLGTEQGLSAGDDVLASGNDLWLKSPLHPWANQRVALSIPQEPDCVPESAIFFQSMADEARTNRTVVATVNNRKNPIPMTRLRGGISSTLTLITRRFADRDAVIVLNESGDPLMFQGPADYGIPDRYLTVDEYSIARLTTDHKVQWRAHTLPHVQVDRPAGLSDGVLGTRWVDLCALYGTFDAANAAGLTWELVMLGAGSLSPRPTPSFRLYSDIPIDFATYGAIPVGGRTYEDLFEDR